MVDGDNGNEPAPGLLELSEHEPIVDTAPYNHPAEHSTPTCVQVRDSEEVMELLVFSPVNEFGLDASASTESYAVDTGADRFPGRQRTSSRRTIASPRAADGYEMKSDVLMRKVHLKARAGPARTVLVPVIPLPFIETVPYYCQRDIFSSHSGRTKSIDKVRKHAYWQGWKRDVIEYVRVCTVWGMYDLSGPFSLVVVDAIGPLMTTLRANKYILAFADYFTRWAEAFPFKRFDTVTFVNLMVSEVVSRHGVPERLLSDRGSNFILNLAQSFCQTLGIKKLFGAAYHPQMQGLVERFNGTLLGMLRMFIGETQEDWDLYLPRVLFTYLATYRRRLFLSMRDSRRMVERQLLKAQGRHTRRLEGQVAVSFAKDDAVWIYQYFRARRGERNTKKLAFSWHGPYRELLDSRRGTLLEEDHPTTSFVERVVIGDEETAFTGVTHVIVDVLAKHKQNGKSSTPCLWLAPTTAQSRLVDANAAADEDELLF
ncbi:LOW QUALITY PROTEIN: hypothetical protein PHMEG_00020979 [Phytophthora megakarya]|uniref:Integrase catalytic domain-containing protein n=1 Tax=Phytophthora megakarya TaxID=4795 RepID=A0A225VNZ6_9STRA|nr:LOW QUALITY PROTEIN: hypothetical protein PHMEG_00020979 [Phytophthora megakarya]